MIIIELIEFDCRLTGDENEGFVAKSKDIALEFCRTMTKIEID